MDKTAETKIVDLSIRLLFLGLIVYSAFVMVAPFAGVVIWAVILCVALYPSFHWLQNKLGGRKTLAATLLVLVGMVLTLGPIATAVSGVIDVTRFVYDKAAAGTLHVPAVPENLKEIPVVGSKLTAAWALFEKNLGQALATIGPHVLELSKAVLGKAVGIGTSLLGLAVSVIIMGVLFAPGPTLVAGVQKFANRVFAPRGAEYVTMAGATIRNVTKGVIGVAAIQSAAIWVLFAVFGIQSAATLALICLILSIIQLGPLLVLIPVAIYVFSTMSVGIAVLFAVFAIPVALMDNFLRPYLMSKGLQSPMLVILIGVIGGMMAYGLIGVFMGPVLLSVFYELFTLWLSESEAIDRDAE